ncbi:MAG TPA: hypothetical protein VFQ29_11595 [Methyloceanibacter sp.]|nr:hypothetical protein [Methyloceanibacter sp.]
MRDIRGELQERASLLEEQINAHQAGFERHIEQLKREHDSRLEDINAELEGVAKLMEFELRRFSSAPAAPTVQTREPVHHALHQPAQQSADQPPQHSAHQSPQHSAHQPVPHSSYRPQPQPQTQPEQPLADFLVRKLNEAGAMSLDDLRRLALHEGYFADAGLDVHNALFNAVKAGLIRQLPGGDFAPATIRLRRAM